MTVYDYKSITSIVSWDVKHMYSKSFCIFSCHFIMLLELKKNKLITVLSYPSDILLIHSWFSLICIFVTLEIFLSTHRIFQRTYVVFLMENLYIPLSSAYV